MNINTNNYLRNRICPFCNSSVPVLNDTVRKFDCFFNADIPHFVDESYSNLNKFIIELLRCPNCQNVSFIAFGQDNLAGLKIPLYPTSLAKKFPNYIPKAIREDYEEAYSIVNLSPKASATLSRRCLQGMIRDFWNISERRLIDEIDKLQPFIPTSQWKAINSLRKIGNIGAHMEGDINTIIDVDVGEAEKLLKLIELLIDKWYIARHDEEELLIDIKQIADNKDSKKML